MACMSSASTVNKDMLLKSKIPPIKSSPSSSPLASGASTLEETMSPTCSSVNFGKICLMQARSHYDNDRGVSPR